MSNLAFYTNWIDLLPISRSGKNDKFRMKGRGAAAYVLSPEQQLKEKRPGMPENLKRIREQQITDIPRIPFEPELNH